MPEQTIVDFHKSFLIRRPCERYGLTVEGEGVKLRNVTVSSGKTFPLPLPGPRWGMRVYRAFCWYFGRSGRA